MATVQRRVAAIDVLLGLFLFVVLDASIFGAGWYRHWVDPQSRDGFLGRSLNWPLVPAANRAVLVLGDSRIGEGFSAPAANDRARNEGAALTFVNGSMPSSTFRTQYLLLREHIARGHRPSIVVLMTASYHDNELEDLADRVIDPGLAHTLLRIGDVLDYPWTFPSWPMRAVALRTVLLSGYDFKADVASFLSAPQSRISQVTAWHRDGQSWLDAYPGRSERMAPRQAGCDDEEQGAECAVPDPQPPANARSAGYRAYWLDRIAALCRQADIRLVMLEIPRGPHHLGAGSSSPQGSLADLAAAGTAELIPATAFRELERPRYFFDDLHLNAEGRARFSTMLADRIIALPAATLPAAAR